MDRIRETTAFKLNGFWALAGLLGLVALLASLLIGHHWVLPASISSGIKTLLAEGDEAIAWIVAVVAIALPSVLGFVVVEPNQAVVLTFFGRYCGTIREDGFWWTNPFVVRRRVSLRVRNFDTSILKVNDAQGNPIEIGAVVVWQVSDAAKSQFEVENYGEFIATQSETAVRALAVRYPYDGPDREGVKSLRGVPDEIAVALREELRARLQVAGVEVLEARLSHLAYAPEVAQVMLRRQQAQAIIDARRQIVESAVGMVDEALRRLSEHEIVDLDEERKAMMVNNLLVVLTSDHTAQPVLNAGTLY